MKTTERPMQKVIDQATALGYKFSNDSFTSNPPPVIKYDQCLKIKDWIFETFEVYTCVVLSVGHEFTPIYNDLARMSIAHADGLKCKNPKQAVIEGLLYALEYIDNLDLKIETQDANTSILKHKLFKV